MTTLTMSTTSMGTRARGVVDRIMPYSGKRPILFLDSGVIFDFEEEVARRWRRLGAGNLPENFYTLLTEFSGGVFVTDEVLDRVVAVNNSKKRQGNSLASDEGIEAIKRLNESYHEFESGAVRYDEKFSLDMARLDAFHAVNQSFQGNGRTPEPRHWNLVGRAAASSYLLFPSSSIYAERGKPVILTSDCKVKRAVETMAGREGDLKKTIPGHYDILSVDPRNS